MTQCKSLTYYQKKIKDKNIFLFIFWVNKARKLSDKRQRYGEGNINTEKIKKTLRLNFYFVFLGPGEGSGRERKP